MSEGNDGIIHIKEFAAMTGLSQSQVRFYEKHGLFDSMRQENGYRTFTPEYAFRVNAFRMLLQYGFGVDQAIEMLDERQDSSEFELSLGDQKARLEREAQLLRFRLERIEQALALIKLESDARFTVLDVPDYLYVRASKGRDFHVSLENEAEIAEYYSLLSVASCARIIAMENFLDDSPAIDPSYVIAIPEVKADHLSESAKHRSSRLIMGKCVCFQRWATREESARKSSFEDLQTYLASHGYHLRNNILLVPGFLNLDGRGKDVETLMVPID